MALRSAQSDGARAVDHHGAAGRNVGALGARPSGGQVVGEQQRLFGVDAVGDRQQLEVRGRHGEQIGLCAAQDTGAEDLRTDTHVTGSRVAQPAQCPQPATDETSTRSPAFTLRTSGTDLGDRSHRLVAQGHRLDERIVAVPEVQIRSADRGVADGDDRAVGPRHRVGAGVDPDRPGPSITTCA